MQSYTFSDNPDCATIGILIKNTAFNIQAIHSFYVNKINIPNNRFAIIGLFYNNKNKVTAIEGRAYTKLLLEGLESTNITILFVADANYFKFLTGKQKVKAHRGYELPCSVVGYTHLKVILSVNYNAISHNPNQIKDLNISLQTLANSYNGNTVVIGTDIIQKAEYPKADVVKTSYCKLHKYPILTCDIETYSLRFEKAGIATISFAWSPNHGMAFNIDFNKEGKPVKNEQYSYLCEFFNTYQGTLIFHNILFEIKVFVYWLYMAHDADWPGMRKGLDIIAKFDDTMIMAYLCVNNTIENQLSLKEIAYEHAGSYAIDVKDITQHELPELLKYNLIDSVNTFYAYNKFQPLLAREKQLNYYNNTAKPFIRSAAKMMLMGLPMDMVQVQAVKRKLEKEYNRHQENLRRTPEVKYATELLTRQRWLSGNAKLKKKLKPMSDYYEVFNPNSDQQKRTLLYNVLRLPVIATTDNGAPSASIKVIKRLENHPIAQKHKTIIDALISISQISIILNTFIHAFIEYAFTRNCPTSEFHNTVWLNGSLKTTGTKSTRLSSSDPNMQNLPSKSIYGELIKSCFVAPNGWLIAGADYAALEDKINALRTQDPAKIKVYSDGYDGHNLRSYTYFGDQMPGIQQATTERCFKITTDGVTTSLKMGTTVLCPDGITRTIEDYYDSSSIVKEISVKEFNVHQINSIANKYPELRQKSKSPSFALQYNGTHQTLVNNLGFEESQAIKLENAYKELYKVSFQYNETLWRKAAINGYISLAFGAKLRCPALSKWNGRDHMSPSQLTEARSVANADSQSYGQLMNRAIVATELKIEASAHVEDILILNIIHDAVYYLVRKNVDSIKFLNDTLIKEMEWTEDPNIQHPDIPMTAELNLGPSWDQQTTLKNKASKAEIEAFLETL